MMDTVYVFYTSFLLALVLLWLSYHFYKIFLLLPFVSIEVPSPFFILSTSKCPVESSAATA